MTQQRDFTEEGLMVEITCQECGRRQASGREADHWRLVYEEDEPTGAARLVHYCPVCSMRLFGPSKGSKGQEGSED